MEGLINVLIRMDIPRTSSLCCSACSVESEGASSAAIVCVGCLACEGGRGERRLSISWGVDHFFERLFHKDLCKCM